MRDVTKHGRAGEHRRIRIRGFSLVELIVVMVLAASAAVAAAPTFSAWHARDRVDGAARALLAGLTFAHGEAIARGERVVVCPIDGNLVCLPSGRACAGGVLGWSCGWAVVVEPERIGSALRIHRPIEGVSIAATVARVEFTPPTGQVIGGFRRFEFAAVPGSRDDRLRRCIRIASGGRARLEQGGCVARGEA